MIAPEARVTLGVDQATASGWSIHLGFRPVESGVVDVWDWQARRSVIRKAYDLANRNNASVSTVKWFLFVYEDHSAYPLKSYKSTAQVLGLGGARDLWLDSLNRMGHPGKLRHGVSVRSWRADVLGLRAALKGDECKAQALRWARDHTGRAEMGFDEAEALAISAYGALRGWQGVEHRSA